MRLIILITILLIILTATVAQAQTYLPIIGGGDIAGAEISYGIYQELEPHQWLDVECATGVPVAIRYEGLLHIVCR